ncbi:MAG: hypothetical protein IKB99_00100 [Lentisphaeria bacterium]|nr:hypothetical protein [Lentisphaeria bacterium]
MRLFNDFFNISACSLKDLRGNCPNFFAVAGKGKQSGNFHNLNSLCFILTPVHKLYKLYTISNSLIFPQLQIFFNFFFTSSSSLVIINNSIRLQILCFFHNFKLFSTFFSPAHHRLSSSTTLSDSQFVFFGNHFNYYCKYAYNRVYYANKTALFPAGAVFPSQYLLAAQCLGKSCQTKVLKKIFRLRCTAPGQGKRPLSGTEPIKFDRRVS